MDLISWTARDEVDGPNGREESYRRREGGVICRPVQVESLLTVFPVVQMADLVIHWGPSLVRLFPTSVKVAGGKVCACLL